MIHPTNSNPVMIKMIRIVIGKESPVKGQKEVSGIDEETQIGCRLGNGYGLFFFKLTTFEE